MAPEHIITHRLLIRLDVIVKALDRLLWVSTVAFRLLPEIIQKPFGISLSKPTKTFIDPFGGLLGPFAKECLATIPEVTVYFPDALLAESNLSQTVL